MLCMFIVCPQFYLMRKFHSKTMPWNIGQQHFECQRSVSLSVGNCWYLSEYIRQKKQIHIIGKAFETVLLKEQNFENVLLKNFKQTRTCTLWHSNRKFESIWRTTFSHPFIHSNFKPFTTYRSFNKRVTGTIKLINYSYTLYILQSMLNASHNFCAHVHTCVSIWDCCYRHHCWKLVVVVLRPQMKCKTILLFHFTSYNIAMNCWPETHILFAIMLEHLILGILLLPVEIPNSFTLVYFVVVFFICCFCFFVFLPFSLVTATRWTDLHIVLWPIFPLE